MRYDEVMVIAQRTAAKLDMLDEFPSLKNLRG
jgi:hypothetical protein